MSIYGFVQWKRDNSLTSGVSINEIVYRKLPLKVFVGSIVIYLAATLFLVMVLGKTTDDPMPWVDSSITVLSAIATYWLSKSYKEQWLMWLVVNVLTVAMAVRLELFPTAVLYSVNAVASVYGFVHWIRKGNRIQ